MEESGRFALIILLNFWSPTDSGNFSLEYTLFSIDKD